MVGGRRREETRHTVCKLTFLAIISPQKNVYPSCTEDPRYNDSICFKRDCCLNEFAVVKNPKMQQNDTCM